MMDVFDHENDPFAEAYAEQPHCPWFNPPDPFAVPPRCKGCNYYMSVEDDLCQFCSQAFFEGSAAMFAGIEQLLTSHLAFARHLGLGRAEYA